MKIQSMSNVGVSQVTWLAYNADLRALQLPSLRRLYCPYPNIKGQIALAYTCQCPEASCQQEIL